MSSRRITTDLLMAALATLAAQTAFNLNARQTLAVAMFCIFILYAAVSARAHRR